MGRQNAVLSEFYCTQCGNKGIPIMRRRGAEREAGHLKKIYCLKCKQELNHVECKPFSHYDYNDFLQEFEYGNFSEDGQRKVSYGELKGLILNGKVERKNVYDDGMSGCGEEYLP